MPPADSAVLIVARFLKANHFTESYKAFVEEGGLPEDAGAASAGDLTLEKLLEEKKTFDLSVQFEKLGTGPDDSRGWTLPAPTKSEEIKTLPNRANILSTAVENVVEENGSSKSVLLVSTADRKFHELSLPSSYLRSSTGSLHDSPILISVLFNQKYLLTGSMSGQLVVSDFSGKILEKRNDHAKYIVKIATFEDSQDRLVATAGWDNKVNLYVPTTSTSFQLQDPIATIVLPTKPESILFLRHPENSQPILLVSRTDSNHLFYYTAEKTPRSLGKQNLAPHSNAWIAFTPTSLSLCPTDPTLVAVGTNSVPHMKLLIVRLLIPPYENPEPTQPTTTMRASLLDDPSDNDPNRPTQASVARAALAIAERESSAIQIHCTTLAPQTAYSTPTVAWRPDGSGVWVNGDDGAVRGIEAGSGKVVATLRSHEDGSKVRCLWAGNVDGEDGDEKEVLISGGFDQRLILWRI